MKVLPSDGALAPAIVVTLTDTEPACPLGEMETIDLSDLTVKLLAGTPPNSTEPTDSKPSPTIAFKGKPWHEVVAARAGESAADRYKRITEFVSHYGYAPPYDLKSATADLYAEAGEVAMALIRTKIKRTKEET